MANKLYVKVYWSKNKVKEGKKSHIIFEIKNKSGKMIVLTGYKMENSKENNPSILSAKNWNESDPHVNIILWNKDEHIFHWSDVNVTSYYNLMKGKWYSFVQIRFLEKGSEKMETSNIVSAIINII